MVSTSCVNIDSEWLGSFVIERWARDSFTLSCAATVSLVLLELLRMTNVTVSNIPSQHETNVNHVLLVIPSMLYPRINEYYKVPSINKTVLRKTYQNSFLAFIYPFSVFTGFFNHAMFYMLSLHKKWGFPSRIFFSKYDQICKKLRICSHLLKKSLMENFFFCAVCLMISAFPSLISEFTSLGQ